jgi:hypothetical protein
VHQVARRQLAAADARIGEQRGVAAFDVDPAVGAGGAAVVGQGVELFLAFGQVQRQGFEARARCWKSMAIRAEALARAKSDASAKSGRSSWL